MNSITIDGMEEMEFRRSIESMLRNGQADDAADKLKTLLADFAGEGQILPERFLSVTAEDIRLEGWDQLGDKLGEYDRPEVPMSAISIDILDPQGIGARPDSGGCLKPVMETSYFSDSAYPFSEADREDLLDGYSSFGCEWQGNFENVDTIISVEGIDDLYGATVGLENKVASGGKAELTDIQAGSVGSCYLAVLIHQAIRDAAREKGLPRPICVLAGSNDAYPFFDAPAMTAEEYRVANGIEAAPDSGEAMGFDDEFDEDVHHGPGSMASLEDLMGLGTKKKAKKPVLTIAPDEADTSESLESLEHPVGVPAEDETREHIMPSLDLGHMPEADDGWQREEIPSAAEWEDDLHTAPHAEPAMSAAFEPELTSTPLAFGGDDSITPIDFGAIPSARPLDFEAGRPPVPADDYSTGDATGPDVPNGHDFPQADQPLELEGFEPLQPGDFEPEAPIDRLPGESAEPRDDAAVPLSSPEESAEHDFAIPANADPGGSDLPGEVPLPAMDEPLDLSREAGGDVPFDLDGFADAEVPYPQSWAAELDLPGNGNTEESLAFPSSDPATTGSSRATEPKPARHAIRVIAASVTNDGGLREQKPAHQDTSLVLLVVLAIGRGCKWLWKRVARR